VSFGRKDRWETFAPSKPIAVEGGLATTRERGVIAESWWSKRFVAVLESFGLGGRMQRGRKYARSGQVISLDVAAGVISSKVQGSRATPYEVSIRVTVPTDKQRDQLDTSMQGRVAFVAQLLAGEVPSELEDAFEMAGVSLFPRSWREVISVCSCPDYENPCKHIAAVLYLFADQLDSDPWLLLTWRGRTREELLAHLTQGAETVGSAEIAARVAPWWPLVPGQVKTQIKSTLRADDLIAEPPIIPIAVLARLCDLSLDGSSVPDIAERLADSYRKIRQE
jgi:uncharacterized Zn finger protein